MTLPEAVADIVESMAVELEMAMLGQRPQVLDVEIRTVRFGNVEGEGLNFCKLRGRSYGKNQAKVWRWEEQTAESAVRPCDSGGDSVTKDRVSVPCGMEPPATLNLRVREAKVEDEWDEWDDFGS